MCMWQHLLFAAVYPPLLVFPSAHFPLISQNMATETVFPRFFAVLWLHLQEVSLEGWYACLFSFPPLLAEMYMEQMVLR